MEVIAKGKGFWKYVERRSCETLNSGVTMDENEHDPLDMSEEIKKVKGRNAIWHYLI